MIYLKIAGLGPIILLQSLCDQAFLTIPKNTWGWTTYLISATVRFGYILQVHKEKCQAVLIHLPTPNEDNSVELMGYECTVISNVHINSNIARLTSRTLYLIYYNYLITDLSFTLGIKSALESAPKHLGHLVVMGTPAEEGGGGKILMLDKGCFDKVDFSMMVHPAPIDAVFSPYLAIQNVFVTFKGKASHAAAFPWEGVNALDAAVLSYNAISMLRQQIKPTWKAHGIFTNGGIEPAIIPEKAQLNYFFRAPTLKELEEFKEKAENCFRAAATATGYCISFLLYVIFLKLDFCDLFFCSHGCDTL